MLFFSSYLTQSDRQTPHSLPVHVGICIIRMLFICLCTFAPVCVCFSVQLARDFLLLLVSRTGLLLTYDYSKLSPSPHHVGVN